MSLAFLAGVLLKVYDDFVDDDPILTNEHVIASLRTAQIVVATLVLSRDFWLCLVFGLFNGLCALSSSAEYSRPHVVSYAVVSPLLLAVSWSARSSLGSLDWAVITTLLGLAVFEPKAFPEELSVPKGIIRLVTAASSFTALWCFPQLSPSVQSLLWIQAGYCVSSSVAQLLKLTACVPTHAWTPAPA
jgi:hypothetical protein